MTSTLGMDGHVALVTGANHGIGAATARLLAESGVGVLITYLRVYDPPDAPVQSRTARASDASEIMSTIQSFGGRAVAVEADLTDPHSPKRLFDIAEAELGPVDILVNNATGWIADTFTADRVDGLGRRLKPVSASSFDQQFTVDARAAALLIGEFASRHTKREGDWGRIIGLTSGGPDGFPGEVSYGAAKAALENYTMSAASELAGLGITANIVHPPVTDTGWVNDEVKQLVADTPNMFHVAMPEEVARVIVYLVSEEARLITGNVIRLR